MFELFDRRCKSRDSIYHLTWFILPFHIIWLEFQLLILRFTDFRSEIFARPTSATSENTLRVGISCRSFYESCGKDALLHSDPLSRLSRIHWALRIQCHVVWCRTLASTLFSLARLSFCSTHFSSFWLFTSGTVGIIMYALFSNPFISTADQQFLILAQANLHMSPFFLFRSAHKFAENLLHRLLGGLGAVKRKSRTSVIYAEGVRSKKCATEA